MFYELTSVGCSLIFLSGILYYKVRKEIEFIKLNDEINSTDTIYVGCNDKNKPNIVMAIPYIKPDDNINNNL